MKAKSILIGAAVIVAAMVIIPGTPDKTTNAPAPSKPNCPTTAPADTAQVGTVTFQTGATHVIGGGGIKVTGGGTSWEAKSERVNLSVDRQEVAPPDDPKFQDKPPSAQTRIINAGLGAITLVDNAKGCAMTLKFGAHQDYVGSVTITVYAAA